MVCCRTRSIIITIMSLLILSMARPKGKAVLAAAFASSAMPPFHLIGSSKTSTRQTTPSRRHHHSYLSANRRANSNIQSHKKTDSNRVSTRRHHRQNSFCTSVFMTSSDDDDNVNESEEYTKTIHSEWNVKGLKQEVNRLILRSHKKIGKASTRVRKANDLVEKLTADETATEEQLQACPNVDALELELRELQARLQNLNQLNESLSAANLSSKGLSVLPEEMAQSAIDLGVDDKPPKQTPRGPKKEKGPRQKNPPKTRLPYRKFYTVDKTEIRVGKQAPDNDELSLNAEHRSGSDWWMHASGCPGSHVVIRNGDENINEEVVQDAAALAARQSKCNGSVIKVSMTRCRDVKKPMGAKAGLVQLTGRVRTVTVNMKEAEKRLERLDETVEIN